MDLDRQLEEVRAQNRLLQFQLQPRPMSARPKPPSNTQQLYFHLKPLPQQPKSRKQSSEDATTPSTKFTTPVKVKKLSTVYFTESGTKRQKSIKKSPQKDSIERLSRWTKSFSDKTVFFCPEK